MAVISLIEGFRPSRGHWRAPLSLIGRAAEKHALAELAAAKIGLGCGNRSPNPKSEPSTACLSKGVSTDTRGSTPASPANGRASRSPATAHQLVGGWRAGIRFHRLQATARAFSAHSGPFCGPEEVAHSAGEKSVTSAPLLQRLSCVCPITAEP